MNLENILFAATCWLTSILIGAIALWAFKRKTPMHFWTGSTVNPEEIADIPAYNRANGFMWAIYAGSIALSGVLSLFNIQVGVVLLILACVPGVACLIIAYRRIYKKYKRIDIDKGMRK